MLRQRFLVRLAGLLVAAPLASISALAADESGQEADDNGSGAAGFVLRGFVLEREGGGGPFPIAGVDPDRRPEGAPVIVGASPTDAWYAQALTGLEPPYPGSLRFLEDQGLWFTPFNHPGMTGPYDLRGWHQVPDQGVAKPEGSS